MIINSVIDVITEEPFGPNAVTIVGEFSEANVGPQVCIMQVGTRATISVASYSPYVSLKTLDRAVEALNTVAEVQTTNSFHASVNGKLHVVRKKFKILKELRV